MDAKRPRSHRAKPSTGLFARTMTNVPHEFVLTRMSKLAMCKRHVLGRERIAPLPDKDRPCNTP
jgi:hypothetical protein